MALTHSTTARDAATNAVVDLLDGAASKLVFRVGGTLGSPGAIAATLTFSTPAFGASSAGTATAGAIAADTNAAGNAAAVTTASLQTSGGVIHIYCNVAASGSDINMANGLVIAAGDTVSCSSMTYTALPA
jgi:hypothetical protein